MKLISSYTNALRSTALTVALAPMFAIMLTPACLADHPPENVGPSGNQVPYTNHDATPTDYNNPKQYPAGAGARASQPGVPYWHVTVCDDTEVSLSFKPFGAGTKPFTPNGKDAPVGSTDTEGGPPQKPATSGHHGTISVNGQGDITIKGGSNGGSTATGQDIPGTSDWDVNDRGSGQHFRLLIRVVDCGKYHLGNGFPPRGITSSALLNTGLLGSSFMTSFIPGSSGYEGGLDGGLGDGTGFPPTGNQPHDGTTDDSSTKQDSTISDTTEATAGHPGVFGGSANVTAPEKQFPVETK